MGNLLGQGLCKLDHENVYSVYIAKIDGGLKINLREGLQFIDWKKYVKKRFQSVC